MSAALSAFFRGWWMRLRVGNTPATSASPAPAPVVPYQDEGQTPVAIAVAPQPVPVAAPVVVVDSVLRTQTLEALEKDPALCVRVLRMANSASVRSEKKIEDIFTAVQMLGLRRVSTLAQALFTMRDARNMAGGLDWRHLWVHALATAAIAEE